MAAPASLHLPVPPPAAFAATAAPSSSAVQGEGAVPGQPLHTPAAWTAADAAARSSEWQHVLTPAEADEIVAAARQAAASGTPVPQLTKADFPLPTLGPLLEQFRRNCLHGLGFQLLRGGWVLDRAVAPGMGPTELLNPLHAWRQQRQRQRRRRQRRRHTAGHS